MGVNFYNLLEEQFVATIQADGWLGTTGTNVATIEARLRPGPRSYYDYELPAIAVKVMGMSEGDWSLDTFDRFYRYVVFVIHRGGDLDTVVNDVQKISSALENLLETQYNSANDLHGLGTHADIKGGPWVSVESGIVDYAESAERTYTVLSTLRGDVNLVA